MDHELKVKINQKYMQKIIYMKNFMSRNQQEKHPAESNP